MGQAHALLLPGIQLVPGQLLSNDELPTEIRGHLRALRIQAGEKIDILDGDGGIHTLESQAKGLTVVDFKKKARSEPLIDLCLSLPKKESLWEAISQATELGVNNIFPVASQHNQNPRAARASSLERAQKIADEACCQCRQVYRVTVADKWESLEKLALMHTDTDLFFADEDCAEGSLKPTIIDPDGRPYKRKSGQKLRLFIGPEGGWSEDERAFLRQRAHRMSLGPQILRVPTAIAVAIYQLRYFS